MVRNRFGLARTIPEEVKREVRAACSFGCVICGSVPYDYDHLRVEFKDAKEHDPEDIVLLCPTHHRMKGSILPTASILTARANRAAAMSDSRFKLPATSKDFTMNWAGNIISAQENSIRVDNEPILRFERSDNELEPSLISGSFRDRYGNLICLITNNEVISISQKLGDFALTRNRFRYTLPGGLMGLEFILDAAGIAVTEAFHVKGDAYVIAGDGQLQVGNLISGLRLTEGCFHNNRYAILIESVVDEFSYDRVDLERLPVSSLHQFSAARNFAAINIEGLKRPDYSYTWGY